MLRPLLGILCLVVSGSTASAQQHEHRQPESSPYADLTRRAIKALSPEDIEGLQRGDGMGYALTAELNRYPGPRHVLEWTDSLGLDQPTQERVRTIRAKMTRDAVVLGASIIEAERRLDRAFAAGSIDHGELGDATDRIARLRGRLRAVHLGAHIEVTRLLTAAQVARYDELRGYRNPDGHTEH